MRGSALIAYLKNIDRTSYMIISHAKLPNGVYLKMRNGQLERVSRSKFHGIIIDGRLSFNDNFESLVTKISRSTGIMYTFSPLLPSHVLSELYFSLVFPFFGVRRHSLWFIHPIKCSDFVTSSGIFY